MLPTPERFRVSHHHMDFAGLSASHHPVSPWLQAECLGPFPEALGTLSPNSVSALTCSCTARAGAHLVCWISPFYLGQELGLKDAPGLQPL